MSNLKSYRACFVPLCSNTTKTTPKKMFFNVPKDSKRRNQWFQAAHRFNPKTTSNFFCCEDHFNLKADMENYIYYTLMGGRAKIKVDVVPHKFNCQPNRKRQGSSIPRPASEKRQKQKILQESLTESAGNIEINDSLEFFPTTISVDHGSENVKIDFPSSKLMPGEKVNILDPM